jgi:Glycosyl hydrolases family 28
MNRTSPLSRPRLLARATAHPSADASHKLAGLLPLLAAAALAAPASTAMARDCLVTEHGARANDDVADTVAIQRAIDTCAAAGGGRVVLPNGSFLSGTLFLKSNIELHLAHGAKLLGSPRLADYAPSKESVGSHTEGKRDGLLIAEKVRNVSITGFGTVDGNGESFWDPGFLQSGQSRPTKPRPMPWVEFRDSAFISVRDTTFQNSPSYGVAFTRSHDVHVDNVKIFNDPRSPNTDGIQVNDTQRVTIRAVHIATGDDAIVLKSDNGDVEDVVVSDSILTSDDGAFKLGTSSSKAIRRVTLRDSTMVNSRIGVAMFMRRGGIYEDVEIRNLRFVGRSRSWMEWPIYIDIDRRAEGNTLGAIRDVRISGMRIESRGNVLIAGNPDAPLAGITLRDIEFRVSEPAPLAKLNNKPRGNITAGTVPGSVDYSRENSHITIGHVRGLVVDDVRLVGASPALAARRPMTLIDVAGARLTHLALGDDAAAHTQAPVLLRDSGDVVLAGVRAGPRSAAADTLAERQGNARHGALSVCKQVVSDCTVPSHNAQSAQAPAR